MKILLKKLAVLILVLSSGCTGKHLISDNEYRDLVERSFDERVQLGVNCDTDLFQVFNEDLSEEQTEALKFLYAFMPLSDLADYDGEFFLANTDIALLSKTETAWGSDIPYDIFLHYVLPPRINNENLDSFRIVYYDEIKDRIKGKNMQEAALEINHWCHEKVNYQPSDIRTSSPMKTILSARGRCGEESTFTVAALRTAGIPARQVYTPRWAHTDDNHAWVEIWIAGGWYYMGACEPEPVLDRGWFTEPARRAMLINTKSFGAPLGKENIINRHNIFSEVNNLSKYAVTKRIYVKVLDKDGSPLSGAKVEYQLYNYAEFYPLAVIPTDKNGISSFETGIGDLLIWASTKNKFDFKKISVNYTDTLLLIPEQEAESENGKSIDLDLKTPLAPPPLPLPPAELIDQNARRIKEENILRQKYIDSWMKPAEARSFALNLKTDTSKIIKLISQSMGNYAEITNFLSVTPDSLRDKAVSLLEILSEKDLRDITSDVLSDHLVYCVRPLFLKGEEGKRMFLDYILNPRIANEMIVSWRSYFRKNLPANVLKNASLDPTVVAAWLNDNIKIDSVGNYYNTPITPKGVCELRVSDTDSRAICFVAICRTLGIPSRLEPGINVPQYFLNNLWKDVYFADQKPPVNEKGYLKLMSTETNPEPEYYTHFTIARFGNGRYNTLEYDYNKKISDFTDDLALPPGSYMLVTGNRINDNKILSGISFFNLSANEHKTLEIKLRRESSDTKPIGKVNLKNFTDLFNKTGAALKPDDITRKGVVIIWLDPEQEPSKHVLNDLPLLKKELDAWGGYFIFLTTLSRDNDNSVLNKSKRLPEHTLFATDNKLMNFKNSLGISPLPEAVLPFIVMTDKDGNILFSSGGYRIGIGEQILKHTN
jgi:transglutaminase-like putative cysteine protease